VLPQLVQPTLDVVERICAGRAEFLPSGQAKNDTRGWKAGEERTLISHIVDEERPDSAAVVGACYCSVPMRKMEAMKRLKTIMGDMEGAHLSWPAVSQI